MMAHWLAIQDFWLEILQLIKQHNRILPVVEVDPPRPLVEALAAVAGEEGGDPTVLELFAF
jgi:hypothetical protein